MKLYNSMKLTVLSSLLIMLNVSAAMVTVEVQTIVNGTVAKTDTIELDDTTSIEGLKVKIAEPTKIPVCNQHVLLVAKDKPNSAGYKVTRLDETTLLNEESIKNDFFNGNKMSVKVADLATMNCASNSPLMLTLKVAGIPVQLPVFRGSFFGYRWDTGTETVADLKARLKQWARYSEFPKDTNRDALVKAATECELYDAEPSTARGVSNFGAKLANTAVLADEKGLKSRRIWDTPPTKEDADALFKEIAVTVEVEVAGGDGKKVTIVTDPANTTIEGLKSRIAAMTNIPVWNQEIVFTDKAGKKATHWRVQSDSFYYLTEKACQERIENNSLKVSVLDLATTKLGDSNKPLIISVDVNGSSVQLPVWRGFFPIHGQWDSIDTVNDLRARLVQLAKDKLKLSDDELKAVAECKLYDADPDNYGVDAQTFDRELVNTTVLADPVMLTDGKEEVNAKGEKYIRKGVLTRCLSTKPLAKDDIERVRKEIAQHPITVEVRNVGKTISEKLNGTASMDDLAAAIAKTTGIPAYRQQWVFVRRDARGTCHNVKSTTSALPISKGLDQIWKLNDGFHVRVDVDDLDNEDSKNECVTVELSDKRKVRLPVWSGNASTWGQFQNAVDTVADLQSRLVLFCKHELKFSAEEIAALEKCALVGADPDDAEFGSYILGNIKLLGANNKVAIRRFSTQKQSDSAAVKADMDAQAANEGKLADYKFTFERGRSVDAFSTDKLGASMDTFAKRVECWGVLTATVDPKYLTIQDRQTYDAYKNGMQSYFSTTRAYLKDKNDLRASVQKGYNSYSAYERTRIKLEHEKGLELAKTVQQAAAIKAVLFQGDSLPANFGAALDTASGKISDRVMLTLTDVPGAPEPERSMVRSVAPYAVVGLTAAAVAAVLARNTEPMKKLRYKLFGLTDSLLKQEVKELCKIKAEHRDPSVFQEHADKILGKYKPKDQKRILQALAESDEQQEK